MPSSKELLERIELLEDAQRIMSARNEALYMVCKLILPIALSERKDEVRAALTSCYDTSNDTMDSQGMDDEYQEMMRAALDDLSTSILSVSTFFPRRKKE